MKIQVQLTYEENLKHFGAKKNDIVEVDYCRALICHFSGSTQRQTHIRLFRYCAKLQGSKIQ